MPMPQARNPNPTKQRGQIGPDTQLHKNLQAYETAANTATSTNHSFAAVAIAAVGLGVLALPQIAPAEVVFTPVNQTLKGPRGAFPFDLNNDGIPDVSVSVYTTIDFSSGVKGVDFLDANALQAGNGIAADKQRYAFAGRPGQRLGSSAHFYNDALMADRRFNEYRSSNRGQWQEVKSRRFLGVKFLISGETHFGWIRFSSADASGATVTGYAYETIANKPIIAGLGNEGKLAPEALTVPARGSLGRLAAGARGR